MNLPDEAIDATAERRWHVRHYGKNKGGEGLRGNDKLFQGFHCYLLSGPENILLAGFGPRLNIKADLRFGA